MPSVNPPVETTGRDELRHLRRVYGDDTIGLLRRYQRAQATVAEELEAA